MTDSKYGRIIAIATSLCVVAIGLMLIICCAHMYFTGGDQPFSRERVGDYLLIVAIPSLITIALTVFGFVFAYINKLKDDERAPRSNVELLHSFVSRYEFDSFDAKVRSDVLGLRRKRITMSTIAWCTTAISAKSILLYLFLAKFTTENLNSDILSCFAVVLPLAALGCAIHIPKLYYVESLAEKELALLKSSIKEHGALALAARSEEKNIIVSTIARYAILAAAVVFIVIGIFNGGMADVLGKAVRICTECIGLG